MLRRSVLAAAVTIVLVIGGGALAHALWSVSQPLPAVQLTSGSFDITAEWVDEPEVTGLFPGDTATGTARVTMDSDAAWQYRVTRDATGALGEHVDVGWYADAECVGEPLAIGTPNGTALDGETSTDFCVRFTLAPDTPSDLQAATADVTVTVTAEQVLQ
ncbi:hypothetical protein V2J52_00290 [Georgenia sp. MJ173]|uniref:hypothetical protein n=1 Tax=Georgenia sunbinii TaxID=3117728 RepID=UPI002F26B0AA